MFFFLLPFIAGMGLYFYGIINLIRNRVKGYGVTMGGLMVHTHMTITGSILISLGLVFSGILHWALCILCGIIFFFLSFGIRSIIDRKKARD